MDDAIFFAAFNDELEKVAVVREAYDAAKREGRQLVGVTKELGKEVWTHGIKPGARGVRAAGKATAPVVKRIASGVGRQASKAGAAIKKKVGPMASDALRQAKTKAGAATMAGALALGGGGGAAVNALKSPPPPTKREQTIAKLKRRRIQEKEKQFAQEPVAKEIKRRRAGGDPKTDVKRPWLSATKEGKGQLNREQMERVMRERRQRQKIAPGVIKGRMAK